MTTTDNRNGDNSPSLAASVNSSQLASPLTYRILVIDDTRAIHEDFRKILSSGSQPPPSWQEAEAALFGGSSVGSVRQSYRVDSAFQGEEGVAAVAKANEQLQPYAVAFMDVRMPPGMDGIETTVKLFEIDPDIQIVICTAYSDYSWHEMSEKLGNSDRVVILKKPFDTIEVLQLASTLTEKWRLLQQTKRRLTELENLVLQRTRYLEAANASLQSEVTRRTRHEECLSLQNDITRLLADSSAASGETVSRILQIICQSMRWDVGRLWTVDRKANVMRCGAIWHRPGAELAPIKLLSEHIIPGAKATLAGRVWQSGEPEWMADAGKEDNAAGSLLASIGLRAGVAFPLRLQGEMLGVVEFRTKEIRQPEQDVLDLFATLGSLIGHSLHRKQLEEQLRQSQKMDAVGHLAGGVAHDFNNILTVIQGFAQMLRAEPGLNTDTVEGLNQIVLASQRAASLTRQLLAFSRKQVMQSRRLDLNEVVGNLVKMLRRIIGEDIAFQFEPCSQPAHVVGDEDMIAQILMNLAANARDAMPKGGKLTVSLQALRLDAGAAQRHPDARAGDYITLSVTDTGTGITPENLNHVFEPFFTTKAVGKGTGLGLSTVYGIVKQHQGWIEVSSQVSVGTIFTIIFPRETLAAVEARSSSHVNNHHRGNETILLVEDEEAVRRLGRSILQRHGYRVIEASSGLEALSVWDRRAHEINLLLTDVVMPEGINGHDLARKLRQARPELNVVFTSGYDPDRLNFESTILEGIQFVQKPYSVDKLLSSIRRSLDTPAQKPIAEKSMAAA
jgi:two-component system, cell cycle sensor histidine kinase and response regulator CckA